MGLTDMMLHELLALDKDAVRSRNPGRSLAESNRLLGAGVGIGAFKGKATPAPKEM